MSEHKYEWPTSSPEQEGMDPVKVENMRQVLAEHGTSALLIMRNDRVVCEWYGPGCTPATCHGTASLAKGLVGGTALVTAVNDGFIKLDDKACDYIPAWRDDPLKSKITIRHLISHTSGIQDAEMKGVKHEELPGWMGRFWRHEPDPFSIAVNEALVIFEPGTAWAYSNPGYAALAYAITASLRNSPYKDIQELLRDRIMRPIGVADDEWWVGYRKKYMVDGLPLVATWGGGGYSARAAVSVARLFARGGNWEGKQILTEESAKLAVTPTGGPMTGPNRSDPSKHTVQAIGWANNNNGAWANVPRDAFFGDGAKHRFLIAIPSLRLIAFRGGDSLGDAGGYSLIRKFIVNPLMDAITDWHA